MRVQATDLAFNQTPPGQNIRIADQPRALVFAKVHFFKQLMGQYFFINLNVDLNGQSLTGIAHKLLYMSSLRVFKGPYSPGMYNGCL